MLKSYLEIKKNISLTTDFTVTLFYMHVARFLELDTVKLQF